VWKKREAIKQGRIAPGPVPQVIVMLHIASPHRSFFSLLFLSSSQPKESRNPHDDLTSLRPITFSLESVPPSDFAHRCQQIPFLLRPHLNVDLCLHESHRPERCHACRCTKVPNVISPRRTPSKTRSSPHPTSRTTRRRPNLSITLIPIMIHPLPPLRPTSRPRLTTIRSEISSCTSRC